MKPKVDPSRTLCYFYSIGACTKGDSCEFLHEMPEESTPHQMKATTNNHTKSTDTRLEVAVEKKTTTSVFGTSTTAQPHQSKSIATTATVVQSGFNTAPKTTSLVSAFAGIQNNTNNTTRVIPSNKQQSPVKKSDQKQISKTNNAQNTNRTTTLATSTAMKLKAKIREIQATRASEKALINVTTKDEKENKKQAEEQQPLSPTEEGKSKRRKIKRPDLSSINKEVEKQSLKEEPKKVDTIKPQAVMDISEPQISTEKSRAPTVTQPTLVKQPTPVATSKRPRPAEGVEKEAPPTKKAKEVVEVVAPAPNVVIPTPIAQTPRAKTLEEELAELEKLLE